MKAARYDTGYIGLLDSRVLVLNKHYTAIRVINVRRAFTLLCKDAAEVLAKTNGRYGTYGLMSWIELSNNGGGLYPVDEFIHTPSIRVRVPRVIRLIAYDKFRRQALRISRKNIMARDNNHCQYCGKKVHPAKLSIDHILPRSRGGLLTWDNVVASCSRCNTRKGRCLPHEAGMKLLKRPQAPTQDPYIPQHIKDSRYTLWQDFVKSAPPAR